YGAHPDDGGDKGWTPLFVAALTGQEDTVALLLSYSACINEVNPVDGRTPLHAAAEVAAIDVVEILLRHGADVHARDVHGKTPAETVGVGLGPEVLAQLHEEGLLAEGDMVDDEELMRLMIEHPRAKAVRE
ncbi:serine/threonine-protein kinase ripk4, putative, partial [Perkinsus marinus ATCC 50983]